MSKKLIVVTETRKWSAPANQHKDMAHLGGSREGPKQLWRHSGKTFESCLTLLLPLTFLPPASLKMLSALSHRAQIGHVQEVDRRH